MKHTVPILFVSLAVVLSTIADVFLKKSQMQNYSQISIGVLLYALGALPVAAAFKLIDFSLVFFIWEAVAIILGVTLGIIIFREDFSWFKFGAFFFAAISLVLSYLASSRA